MRTHTHRLDNDCEPSPPDPPISQHKAAPSYQSTTNTHLPASHTHTHTHTLTTLPYCFLMYKIFTDQLIKYLFEISFSCISLRQQRNTSISSSFHRVKKIM